MRNALASITILLILPGCAAIEDWHYSTTNCLLSECAWVKCAKNPLRILCPSDYGVGWKEGYRSIAMGGAGNPPTLPPKQYWSPKYQSPDGQQAIAAWYAGFHDGAVAAESSGTGQFHYLRPYGMPAACPDHNVIESHPEVLPPEPPPAGPSELPLGLQSQRLPPSDNQAVNDPPLDGSPFTGSVPTVVAPGSGRAGLHPPLNPVTERLPSCSDTAYDSAVPPANMIGNVRLVTAESPAPNRP
jgi:hypothetical protein